MSNLFWTVLSLSVSGSLVALALFACRLFYRDRLRKSWQYYIWLVVLLRLLLPFGMPGSLMGSLFSRAEVVSGQSQAAISVERVEPVAPPASEVRPGREAQTAPESGGWALPLEERIAEAPPSVSEMEPSAPVGDVLDLRTLAGYLWVIWLGGGAVLLARKLGSYRLFLRRLGNSLEPVGDPALLAEYRQVCARAGVRRAPVLCTSDAVSAPMLTGALHPRIILPRCGPGVGGLGCVLLHELTHHRRRDLWVKWVTQITLCIHWFNPVVHLVAREMGRACELSCDEQVVRSMSLEQKYGYGDTLLATVGRGGAVPTSAGSLSLGEDARLLKERLGSILNHHKFSRTTRYVSVLLTVMLLAGAAFVGVYAASGGSLPLEASVLSLAKDKGREVAATVRETVEVAEAWPTSYTGSREGFQSAVLPQMQVEELVIKVDDAGLKVELSADDRFRVEHNPSYHTWKYSIVEGKLQLTVTGVPYTHNNNGWVDTTFWLSVPEAAWNKLRIESDDSAVSLPELAPAGEVTMEVAESAVSAWLPANFTGTLNMTCKNSAVSVLLYEDPTDLTVELKSASSAVSMPADFPTYLFQPTYSHTVGSGTAKLTLDLTSCAFSLKVKDEWKDYARGSDSGLSWLAGLAGTEEISPAEVRRLQLDEAPVGLRDWLDACDRQPGLTVTWHDGSYYLYFNSFSGFLTMDEEVDGEGNRTVTLRERADNRFGQTPYDYFLLELPDGPSLTAVCGQQRAQYVKSTQLNRQ